MSRDVDVLEYCPAIYDICDLRFFAGAYILENTPPGGGKYQPMSFGGKNIKRQREKGGKCKRKRQREKGGNYKRKRQKGEENEERGKNMRKGEVRGKRVK